ncbi:NeuD/PglB/VioB family sugar acetyltransferase [Yokenella regensburgei]|uniref:NeuD/PglB/VioB family sugar acetyltransferase n=1 Tax=Yokenella regensburgei TaxID=158877 RepID=UPI0013759C4F|nr:NeuD/PglB/VioB family sugar acetyltransferase [Yokenella regensburgei]KAF1367378.1 sugar O-acyltransferase (sialic acid O-acetyltransferase NeuD family) [Yokenella regensburgei]
MRLGIYGAGGQGRETLVLARQINRLSFRWSAIFFIDDVTGEKVISGADVVRFADLDFSNLEISIALGEPLQRQRLAEKVAPKAPLATLIHPGVFVPEDSLIGQGSILAQGVFLSCDVTLGENVLVQPNAYISHDCEVGPHSVISSQVSLGGRTRIGARNFLGMNAVVKEKVTLGDDVVIGMGAVVLDDIADSRVAFGHPARIQRMNNKRIFS